MVLGQYRAKYLIQRCLRALALLLIVGVIGLVPSKAHAAKYSSIVVDGDTGTVLGGYNMHAKRYPASLTKSMTLYMVFEQLQAKKLLLSTKIRISKFAAGKPPSKLGLRVGTSISLKNAILSLVTKSANDVAAAVAEHIGGTESKFAVLMTRKARQLGMNATQFKNASGLPNSAQITTAHDMAILGVRLYKDFPEYYKYFAAKKFSYRGITYSNHNRLLRDYSGVDGIKTGYIRASGYNLLASAKRGNRRLVAVVFGGSTGGKRNNLVKKWLNHGFARINTPSNKSHQQITLAPSRSVSTKLAELHNLPTETTQQIEQNIDQGSGGEFALKINDSLLMQALLRGDQELPFGLSNLTSVAKVISSPKINLGNIVPVSAPNLVSRQTVVASNRAGAAQWKVQVGAYRYQKQALNALNNALETLGWRYTGKLVKNRRMYLAQVVGMDQTQANQACSNLRGKNIDCLQLIVR